MIYIDRRAGSVELKPSIRPPNMLVTLPFGDVAFTGNGPDGDVQIGIEYKKLPDFIQSITSGRLSGHQLPGMMEMYAVSYLIIEGVWKREQYTGELLVSWDKGHSFKTWSHGRRPWSWEALMHYKDTIQTFMGIRTEFTRDRRHTVDVIHELYSWWRKPWKQHQSHLTMPKRPNHQIQSVSLLPEDQEDRVRKPSTCQCIARELPSVGIHRCRDVADYFGHDTSRMLEAEMKEWTKITGIGKVTAKSVWEELHKRKTQKEAIPND